MDTRPFCSPCQRRFRCHKNEVATRYSNNDRPASLGDSILVGDLWKCPGCGHEIVVGWAQRPWSPYEYLRDAERIFEIAKAIDASGKGYVALDSVLTRKPKEERDATGT